MNYKNSTVRKVLLGATLFSVLTTSLPNSVVAADTYVTNNVESTSTVDKDENQWEADDFVYDTIFIDELGKNIVLVKGFSEKGLKKLENTTSLTIPKYSASGDLITGIGENAFSNTNIVNLNLPDSIEIICDGAFSNSPNKIKIESIKLPKNLKIIEEYSFFGNGISSIELPNNLEKIGKNSFSQNALREIELPDSVNEIGIGAFSGNIINSVKLPKNIQKISYGAFSHNRIKDIILPESVIKIEEDAFSHNRIENLTIPKSIKYLSGFSNNNLTNIKLPDTLEIIGERAFSSNNIKKLNIPNSVKEIGPNSFSINNISDLVLSSSLKTIEAHSFYYNKLENVNIPNSVNLIGANAFSFNKISKIKLSDNLKEIGRDAFRNNLLEEVDFPESIIKIGESAFDQNSFTSFKNFPKNLISSDSNNITKYEGYLDQRIVLTAVNGNFNLSLEDAEKSYEINDPSIIKKSDGTYSLKKDPQFNYRRLRLKVEPYWDVEINNIINFNISYDPNGGVGKINNETIKIDDFYNLKLPENKFTAPQGKKFIGWKPVVEYHSDYHANKDELIQRNRLFLPGSRAANAINGDLRYMKSIKFIAQWEDINKDTNPPRRPDNNRPNIQDVNLNNTKDYIKRLLRNEGILTPSKSNQIDKAQTVDELIYLNNLYLKDKYNQNKNTQTVVEKHYIEKPVYIYNNETRYIDRNTKSHIASYVPKYISNDFTKSDEKQNDVKDSKVQKNNNTSKYFKFLIGMNLYYKNIDGKDELFEMDVAPFIENDRTMMPLRYVAEALSCDVKWDNKTRTASFTKDGVTASIQIDGDEIVLSNGEKVKMDSKPIIKNDRLCVSLTNVAKVFNLTNGNTKDKIDQDIEWDQESKTVTINLD
ncbi:leucine-rich repeat protein [Peptoniphilus harei]|uniref:Copper amine oxidase N-terminal domain n=1 Tax=Peptoniphilus harei TaxID=54005 RepID=A0A2X1XVT9_9FIRM|nr:leucine-rich repeat protein [Peptoniphilus harei]QQT91777.1 leucine-rich repeat protein [Peptoniphilus harei]SPY46877.1 Copper amine oxidase N-terminal domain [Peptoniphilus harei]